MDLREIKVYGFKMTKRLKIKKKEKTQGLLKDFLPAWDRVMFDLHREIIQAGGLEKEFPGIRHQAR